MSEEGRRFTDREVALVLKRATELDDAEDALGVPRTTRSATREKARQGSGGGRPIPHLVSLHAQRFQKLPKFVPLPL